MRLAMLWCEIGSLPLQQRQRRQRSPTNVREDIDGADGDTKNQISSTRDLFVGYVTDVISTSGVFPVRPSQTGKSGSRTDAMLTWS